jgi:hypothetical protein
MQHTYKARLVSIFYFISQIIGIMNKMGMAAITMES